MKNEVLTGVIIALFLIVTIAGYFFFFTPSTSETGGPDYPIDSGVVTTLEMTIIPVSVPLTSPNIRPVDVVNYSMNGYGVWQYGGGQDYEK
ncbi:MAG: hypothetical protein NTV68_05405 [Methanomicrobiales archaeon]|nr:hypothetical protein [Methanomicrobiales archaeon]